MTTCPESGEDNIPKPAAEPSVTTVLAIVSTGCLPGFEVIHPDIISKRKDCAIIPVLLSPRGNQDTNHYVRKLESGKLKKGERKFVLMAG